MYEHACPWVTPTWCAASSVIAPVTGWGALAVKAAGGFKAGKANLHRTDTAHNISRPWLPNSMHTLCPKGYAVQ